MAAHGLLKVDTEYELTVKQIIEKAGSFVSNKTETAGVTMFCHHFILEDDDKITYKTQVCEANDTQNYCNVGDVMVIRVKAFSRDIHTIEFLARDGRPIIKNTSKPIDLNSGVIKEFKETGIMALKNNNKVTALQCAAAYYTYRIEAGQKPEMVVELARVFEKYLDE